MKKKSLDTWERQVVKRPDVPAERVLRQILGRPSASDAHVVHISQRASELAKGAKVISVVAFPDRPAEKEQNLKREVALQNRLEWEAKQLCQPAEVNAKGGPPSHIHVVKK